MKSLKKKENYYFISFVEMSAYCCEAADMLKSIITKFNSSQISEQKIKMHHVEHSADIRKHVMLEKLAKEFITPIETEDIINIAQAIDDVTDSIEEVLLRIYMYNVKEIRSDVKYFADVICESTSALKSALMEFENYKKPEKMKELIIKINHLEENCDELYINAVKKLFETSSDPITILIWEDIYQRLENCCDACEDVADAIEEVIMKNA